MSVIAKILIVLNLLLAVVFLGASATFLGQQESWKKQYNDLKTEMQAQVDDLTTQRDQAREKFREQERVALQKVGEVGELKAELQARDAEYVQINERFANLTGQFERLSQTHRDTISLNETLKQEKDAAIQAQQAAESAKRAAIAAQNAAETETDRLEGVIETQQGTMAELEKRVNSMDEELSSKDVLLAAYMEKVGPISEVMNPPTIPAVVNAVDNDLNIVLLSVGSDDKVKKGYAFTIYRGNQYVGKVIIDKVEKDYCSGYSVKELEKGAIQVGDKATTRF